MPATAFRPPRSGRFTREQADAAKAYVRAHGAPVVVKADGLAAGKGVTVADSVEEALAALDVAFGGAFGDAGATVLIEDCLLGEEASLFALVDGASVLEFGTAQDHKRVGEGDSGPNTGGMGAYAPAPCMTPELTRRAMAEIVRPTVAGMAAEGMPYRGVLYAGLMLTDRGPQLLEFNVRFGDPECQALLPRLMTDLGQLLQGGAAGVLAHMDLRWYPDARDHRGHGGQGLPRRLCARQRDPRPGRRGRGRGRDHLPCRNAHRERPRVRRRRACAERQRERREPGGSPHARLRGDRAHRLAGRLLPARHRLARAGRHELALTIAKTRGIASPQGCRDPESAAALDRHDQLALSSFQHSGGAGSAGLE